MIIAVTRVSHGSLAGSCSLDSRQVFSTTLKKTNIGDSMPGRGRSTFTKRQKEQTRQQRQREKVERRDQRKQEKPEGSVDEMRELREHAEAQAVLFNYGSDESSSAELPEKTYKEGAPKKTG